MVEYYIEAIDQQGRHQTMTLSAKNSTMADELVRSQGLQPTLITHAKAHAQEKQQARATSRRRRQFGLVGAGLVLLVLAGGGGVWFYIQQLQVKKGFTLDAVRMAAEQAGATRNAQGADEELEAFARQLFGAMHLKFPGMLRSVNVKSENLMFVYVDTTAQNRSPEAVRLVARVLADGLQKRFESDRCTVLLIENGVTIADGQYADGRSTVSLHIDE